MSLEILLEAALFVERQQTTQEPNGQPDCEESTKFDGYTTTTSEQPSAIQGRQAAAFYSYQQQPNSRSPSPARANGQRATATSPLHSNASYSLLVEQQQHSSSSSSSSVYPTTRVDDLASRSHRLEEALLRASRKSPPVVQLPTTTTTTTSSSSSSSFNAGGRTSADELVDLKKRSGAGTREVHNKLEKNRRAHLRECFEFLRKQLPAIDDKKLSNLGILKSALRHIQTLKRKEREYEHTMERLAREKISAQQRLAALRKEVPSIPGYSNDAGSLDLTSVVPVVLHSQQVQMIQQQSERDSPLTFANVQAHTIREENHYRMSSSSRNPDQESNSGTSTASERGDDDSYPAEHIKYVRSTSTTPAAYVTMAGGVLELAAGVPTMETTATMPGAGTALYHVRHPASTIVQLAATPQVLAAHHGVQLLTHHVGGSSLKLLTPATAMAGTSVRVIPVSDVSTSLQPLMASASVTGSSKNGGEDSLLNGGAGGGTVFCTPSGVVIPSLVALPEGSSSSTPTSYELPRVSATSSTHFKHSSTIPNSTVLSLPNGLLKATVNRSLQPSSTTTTGVTHVMTPIAVTRSLVTNMAVVGQPAKHVAHILTNSSLDKMGLLKSGSIPIIGGQYLTPATGRQLMKPVMVVAAPPSTSPTTTPRDGSPSTPQTKYPPPPT